MTKLTFLKKAFIATAIAGSVVGLVQAADKTNSKSTSAVSESDASFIGHLAQTNIAEIDGAKVAREKSKSEKVQSFAKTMSDDHSKALDEVNALAKTKNVKIPASADIKHQAALAKLKLLSGEQFDKEYISQAGVNDHKEAKALVSKVSSEAKDPDLKALAQKLAPTIEHHLQMAEKLAGT
jgi:putative membrane protein